MKYKITAYSTALFSTWINVEELNLLIDAGDGLSAGLLQKSGKIKHVFVTHADRDHLTGLPQFMQLNSRDGLPKVYYPANSGSFPAMNDFLNKFDPHVSKSEWIPIEDTTRIEIKKNIFVEAMRNEHVQCKVGVHKSLSYKVHEVKGKLKPQFQSISNKEIQQIVSDKGRDFITENVSNNILSFSGDTPVDDYTKWDGSRVLMHEATFLQNEGDHQVESRGNRHSRLDEVMAMVSEINVETLILNHFSSRYSDEEINASVLKCIDQFGVKVPVHIVYPGEIKRDILNSNPIN